MKKRFLAMAMAMAMTLSLTACGSDSGNDSTSNKQQSSENKQDGGADKTDNSGPIDLTLWGAEEDQTFLGERVEAFKAAYPDQTFNIEIGVESESTAKDTILTDIEAAADVFAFADDQLPDLVDAGAMLELDSNMDQVLQTYAKKSLDDIKSANVEVSITSATEDDKLYAFPMSADNGYFLYYDSTVFSEDDVKTWDGLLAAAKKNGGGRKVGMILASGWYNAGFFYGAGFTTGRNDDGTTTIDWNGTSPDGTKGTDVVQAMLNIASNGSFMAIADGDISNQIASGKLCAVVSGTWDAKAVKKAFQHKEKGKKDVADGYAATVLPTYTAGDKQVQTGSVASCKLIGVNAHSKNSGWAVLLAEFLTNEESQAARFEAREIGPSNAAVQATDAVQKNVALGALLAQNEFATIQKAGGKFWDPAGTFGEKIAQGKIKSDEASIQAALDELVTGVTAPIE